MFGLISNFDLFLHWHMIYKNGFSVQNVFRISQYKMYISGFFTFFSIFRTIFTFLGIVCFHIVFTSFTFTNGHVKIIIIIIFIVLIRVDLIYFGRLILFISVERDKTKFPCIHINTKNKIK